MSSKDPNREKQLSEVRQVFKEKKAQERKARIEKTRELKDKGYTNDHIAKLMNISESTVRRLLKEN